MKFILPVVKPDIGGSLQREMTEKANDAKYIRDTLERLDIENPTIGYFIRNFAKTTKDKKGAAYCGLIVYRLLESQAEANKMLQDEIEAEKNSLFGKFKI